MSRTLFVLLLFIVSHTGFSQIMFEESGRAVRLDSGLQGQLTHSGQQYQANALVASHFTLPFGSVVKVTNIENDAEIVVKVIHRGPFSNQAVIGLSDSAWSALRLTADTRVQVSYLGHDPIKTPEKYIEPYFFLLDAQQIIPQGYGVQIGSFSEKSNLLKAAEKAREQVNDKVIIQVVRDRVYTYRILVGDFPDESEAEKLRSKILDKYPDSFVVGYYSL